MKFLQFAVAAGVALLFSGAALTQSPGVAPPAGTDPATNLNALDADRDGSISRAEAAANPGLATQFVTLDSNTNGALEPAEFARFETLGADTTRGTPGAPGSPGAGSPTRPTPVPPRTPAGTPAPGTADSPSGTSTAPSGGSTAPSGGTPPPGGG
jgi:hypothetical protein